MPDLKIKNKIIIKIPKILNLRLQPIYINYRKFMIKNIGKQRGVFGTLIYYTLF